MTRRNSVRRWNCSNGSLNTTRRIKPQSKKYRLWCLGKLQKTWPELWDLRLDEITPQACKEWAAKLVKEIACHYYNNTLGTLKQVLQTGIKAHKANGGGMLESPAAELKKTRIKQKDLRLAGAVAIQGLGRKHPQAQRRLGAARWRLGGISGIQRDCGSNQRRFGSHGRTLIGSVRKSSCAAIPSRRQKTAKLAGCPSSRHGKSADADEGEAGDVWQRADFASGQCNEALARACKEIGISRLTHHDLRHLFATRCIESGVDIPTVSRWLGHKDGGALAMKTYGHLRNEHSQAMAQKVKF